MIVRKAVKAGRYWFVSLLGVLALCFFLPGSETARSKELHSQFFVYVGTRGPHADGIEAYRFNEETGKIASLGLAAETPSAFSMVASRSGRYLYVANITDNFNAEKSGSVSAFAVDAQSGKLRLLNQVASRGADPAYVSLDETGRFLLVANYTGGSVAVLPIQDDGRLGEATSFVQHSGSGADPERQHEPHPHMISVSPDNRFVLAADLGLDKLLVYRFNSTSGALSPADPAFAKVDPGAGPRHFAFSPNGTFVYIINEMGSTVTAFSYAAASAALHQLQVISTLPQGFTGKNTGAEIAVDRSGRFLYASNRGHDTIAVFAIDTQKGTVRPVQYAPTQGKTPGMFAIDPSGSLMFVANLESGNVTVFRIHLETGRLTPTGEVLHMPDPACVAFVAAH